MNANSSKVLSFCIPVMNRLDALRVTLGQNLEDNMEDCEHIEFIVNCFDKDDSEICEFIYSSFLDYITSGYLVYNHLSYLSSWHFGIAKNSFREVMKGSIYASLDADNFTGYKGGRLIIDTFLKYNYRCIFHQFGGDWGDGSCGRVSLAADDYRKIGYDTKMLPRQWDEIDLILTTIIQTKPVYICYRGKSIFLKSQPLRRFISDQNIDVKQVEIEEPFDLYSRNQGRRSIDTNASDYVQTNSRLRLYSSINHHISYLKNIRADHHRQLYLEELIDSQRELLKIDDITAILYDVFEASSHLDSSLVTRSKNLLTLIAVSADEPNIREWCDYYFNLGVDRIFIVDENPHQVTSQLLKYKPNVYCFVPRYGEFAYAKSFWVELIAKAFCVDQWVLTLDADEYIILPPITPIHSRDYKEKVLPFIAQVADQNSLQYFPGLLIDCVSLRRPVDADIECSNPCIQSIHTIFNSQSIYFRQSPCTPPSDYSHHPTSVWSYGSHSQLPFQYDLRFRYNASIDCLRKFPLFKCSAGVSLNQGFHDIRIDGVRRDPDVELSKGMIIPIAHAKLLTNIFLGRNFNAYHPVSACSIARFARNSQDIFERLIHDPFMIPLSRFPFHDMIKGKAFRRLFLLGHDDTINGIEPVLPVHPKNKKQYLVVSPGSEYNMSGGSYQDRLLTGLVQLILGADPESKVGLGVKRQRPLSPIFSGLQLVVTTIMSDDDLEDRLRSFDCLLLGPSLARSISDRPTLISRLLSASLKTNTFIVAPMSLFRAAIPVAIDQSIIDQPTTADCSHNISAFRKAFSLGACIEFTLLDVVTERRCPYLLIAPSLTYGPNALHSLFSKKYSLPVV